jgi:hypothetical protein
VEVTQPFHQDRQRFLKGARLHRLLKNSRFVSAHRFSDAVTAAKSVAPSGRVPRSLPSLQGAGLAKNLLAQSMPIWQPRFYDFNVWTEDKRIEKLRTCTGIR